MRQEELDFIERAPRKCVFEEEVQAPQAEVFAAISADPSTWDGWFPGLSSGGFFAHQFHIAHSALVTGAGIIAGGPYGCVETITNPHWPSTILIKS